MLEDVYKSYFTLANTIEWKKYSINDLFREYINHENDSLKEAFYAGIVCRVWGYAGRLYDQCKRHVTFEQCYDTILDAINYVLNKRVWEDPNSSLYKDESGPDKAFHIVYKRQRGILLANLNAQKRLSNFNTLSMDEAREDYSDSTDGLLLDLKKLTSEDDKSSEIRAIVKEFFDKDLFIEGLFIDLIAFGDYTTYSNKKIISLLKKLNPDNYNYYKLVYNLEKKYYNKVLYEIYDTSNRALNIRLNKLLYTLKGEL